MTKLRFGVFVLAAALIGTVADSSLSGPGSGRPTGDARHQVRRWALEALPGAGADATRAAGSWPAARAVLTARLETVRLEAAAARRARAARHRRLHPVITRLCRPFQHVATSGAYGADLVVRNDNYGGLRECLANVNRWPNFSVTASAAHRRGGPEPVAFPNIFYGCSWGVCSRGTRLPRRLSRLRNPVTSWFTSGRPPGRWDVAYDIWFARRRRTNGQDDGAEIMLWLRTSGLGPSPVAPSLLIDRHRWQVEHWITRSPASSSRWPLIIFRMVHPRGYVKHLALMPFFRHAESMGLLRRSWWLTAVEAGFEVWRGGAGLRTTSFWVRP